MKLLGAEQGQAVNSSFDSNEPENSIQYRNVLGQLRKHQLHRKSFSMELPCLSIRNNIVPIRLIFTYVSFFKRQKRKFCYQLSKLFTSLLLEPILYYVQYLDSKDVGFSACFHIQKQTKGGPYIKLRTKSEKITITKEQNITTNIQIKIFRLHCVYLYITL